MRSMRWVFPLLAATMMGIAPQARAEDDLTALASDPGQWVMPSGDYAGHRYSRLSQINTANVHDLKVAWSFSTGVLRGHEGGPLIVGDVLYVHTPFPNKVFALDLNDQGRVLWRYEPVQDPAIVSIMCCDTVNRGLAYGDGKIFLYQADTTLVALDAKTGKVAWKALNGEAANAAKGETATSAPFVVKDKVFVGMSGSEYGVRGHLTAYSIKDGKRLWRAYSVGPDADMLIDPDKTTSLGKPVGANSSLSSWEGDEWTYGGGGTWGWYSYDPKLNLLYYGSGNPSTWNPVQRPGDNRWSMSIWARDADTGQARWVYQMTPHDEWDYDGVNEMILTDLRLDGHLRRVLVHFDRNGYAYMLDRASGELLSAHPFDTTLNWSTGVDMKTGRPQVAKKYSPDAGGEDTPTKGICPAALGAKNQQPAAFSDRTRLFYVPTNHLCMDVEPFHVHYELGEPYTGATLTMYPAEADGHLGAFIAWDAAKGKIVWSRPERFSVWSGALATAGGLVFYGTLEGYLKAVDDKTGKELFSFKTPSGIVGNVTTWSHDGTQYIGVLSGVGGWAGIGLAAGMTKDSDGDGAVGAYKGLAEYTSLGGVLTVFSLR